MVYVLLPGFLRRAFWRLLFKFPFQLKRLVGTTVVTAIGMFGQGGGWAMPLSYMTAAASLGGIAEKPAYIAGQLQPREFLCVTMSFDHDIVDGAPAARFTSRLPRAGRERCWFGRIDFVTFLGRRLDKMGL